MLPVVGLKEQSGIFAITKNGHCIKSAVAAAWKLDAAHLRMVESDIFVNWLS